MKYLKSVLCGLLSFLLLCGAGTAAISADDSASADGGGREYCLGDVDVNGVIDITNATEIQRFLAELSLLSFKGENLGDIDRNGKVNISDVTLLQRYLADYDCRENIGELVAPQMMQFVDGTAQPVFSVTPAEDDSYTNFGSTVIRYVVYVETDCDTDLDGKPDLVKAWIKVPRKACEGDYRAPVIYETDPYTLGTISDDNHFPYAEEPIEESALSTEPEKRVPVRTASTEEVAASAKYADWSGYQANLFAADLLIGDEEVDNLARQDGMDYFTIAKHLSTNPQLLGFKLFSMAKAVTIITFKYRRKALLGIRNAQTVKFAVCAFLYVCDIIW